MKSLWAALLLGCATRAESAAWLGLCDAGAGALMAGRVLAEYVTPQGARTALVIGTGSLHGCDATPLPLSPDAVVSARIVAPALAAGMAAGFSLAGQDAPRGFEVSEVVPRHEAAGAAGAAVDVELLPELTTAAFGLEERAQVRREQGRIVLACSAGRRVAGAVLNLPDRGVPRGIPLAAALSYTADGEFAWAISDAARAQNGDPLPLSTLPAATLPAATAMSSVPLPEARLDLANVASFTIACPQKAARIELHSLKLEPRGPRASAPGRALWAWRPEAWQDDPAGLLEKLAKAGADTVFVTVPVDADAEAVSRAQLLEAFVIAARGRGVRVWAVAGDPRAVIESERAHLVRMAHAYQRYNRSVRAEAQLAGVQYDIEPYLNADYALHSAAWHEAYLATLRELRRAADLPIDVALPFWWADRQTDGGPLLERLAAQVEGVTVMNYRTDPAQIKRAAQPFLEWGARHRRAVRIALEYGPIPDEVQRHYRASTDGEAALLTLGAQHVLLQFDRRLALPRAQAFRYSHTTPGAASAVTFAGRRDALLGLLRELEGLWSAWPTFAGAALHEFEP